MFNAVCGVELSRIAMSCAFSAGLRMSVPGIGMKAGRCRAGAGVGCAAAAEAVVTAVVAALAVALAGRGALAGVPTTFPAEVE